MQPQSVHQQSINVRIIQSLPHIHLCAVLFLALLLPNPTTVRAYATISWRICCNLSPKGGLGFDWAFCSVAVVFLNSRNSTKSITSCCLSLKARSPFLASAIVQYSYALVPSRYRNYLLSQCTLIRFRLWAIALFLHLSSAILL